METPLETNFCPKCGSQEFESVIQDNFIERTCPSCGKRSFSPARATVSFCQHCGADITGKPSAESSDNQSVAVSCPHCKKDILVNSTSEWVICKDCNQALNVQDVLKSHNDSNEKAGTTSEERKAPFLDSWQTSIGASIGGFIASGILQRILYAMHVTTLGEFVLYEIFVAAFYGVAIWYVVAYYDKLFEPNCPHKISNSIVSFANLFFGGPIFGCIWNMNLTIKQKGISYYISTV